MKQTAVDWLEKELKKIPFVKAKEVFEQAKQMEKEQIVNAHGHQSNVRITSQGNTLLYLKDGEAYYNETYEQ